MNAAKALSAHKDVSTMVFQYSASFRTVTSGSGTNTASADAIELVFQSQQVTFVAWKLVRMLLVAIVFHDRYLCHCSGRESDDSTISSDVQIREVFICDDHEDMWNVIFYE